MLGTTGGSNANNKDVVAAETQDQDAQIKKNQAKPQEEEEEKEQDEFGGDISSIMITPME